MGGQVTSQKPETETCNPNSSILTLIWWNKNCVITSRTPRQGTLILKLVQVTPIQTLINNQIIQ